MKTLKITLVATLASFVGWWLRLPQKVWSEHAYVADFLMALTLCIVLQFVWPHHPVHKPDLSPKNEVK